MSCTTVTLGFNHPPNGPTRGRSFEQRDILYPNQSHYVGSVSVYNLQKGGEYVEFHGEGIYMDSEGNRYEGNWSTCLKQGEGIMTYANGDMYNGSWEVDSKNGIGTMTYNNGNRYNGNWIEGEKAGNGFIIYSNGDKYDGAWC